MKGESSFDQELLNELLKECKADVEALSEEIAAAQEKIAELEATAVSYDKALSWVELYGGSSIEGKKMIIRQLIKKISIREDFSLNIELNFSYKQFETLLGSQKEDVQASA